MACALLVSVGSSPPIFGVPDEELALKTQSVTFTLDSDLKEIKNGCGETCNAAFYNRNNSVQVTGYGVVGTTADDVGDIVTLANAAVFAGELIVGTLYIKKIQVSLNNEDYVQTTVDLVGWDGIGV